MGIVFPVCLSGSALCCDTSGYAGTTAPAYGAWNGIKPFTLNSALCMASCQPSAVVHHAGEIVERGLHDELLSKKGLYAGMWNEQMQAHSWKLAENKQVI